MSGWLPFLFHISGSPFPSRTPSFPVSVHPDPWDFPQILYPLVVKSYHAFPPAFSCTRTRGCPGSASRRLSFSCRLQLAFWKQSVFLWKDDVQEGVCCRLFRIIFLWHPIMSYLRSQVIKPATSVAWENKLPNSKGQLISSVLGINFGMKLSVPQRCVCFSPLSVPGAWKDSFVCCQQVVETQGQRHPTLIVQDIKNWRETWE